MSELELKKMFEHELEEVTDEYIASLDEMDFSLAKGLCGNGCSGI